MTTAVQRVVSVSKPVPRTGSTTAAEAAVQVSGLKPVVRTGLATAALAPRREDITVQHIALPALLAKGKLQKLYAFCPNNQTVMKSFIKKLKMNLYFVFFNMSNLLFVKVNSEPRTAHDVL